MSSRRLGQRPALDGVRAIAISAVMGLHAIERIVPGGAYGVDVFFVLSAFLITTLILQELEDRKGRYDFRAFYVRRGLRLMPALVLWLFLLALPTALAVHEGHVILAGTVASLLYIADLTYPFGVDIGATYAHAWSLGVEEQFYLVWPAVLVWASARLSLLVRWRLLIAALPAAVLVQVAASRVLATSYFLPTGHLVPLALGCLTAHAFAFGLAPQVEGLAARQPVAVGALVVLAIACCGVRPTSGVAGTAVLVGVAGAAALLVFHACLEKASNVRAALSLAPVRWLGSRSYGLYLYHRTLAGLVPAVVPGLTLRFAGPAVLLMSLAVAELSYRTVESPIRRAGRIRYERQRVSPMSPTPAAATSQT